MTTRRNKNGRFAGPTPEGIRESWRQSSARRWANPDPEQAAIGATVKAWRQASGVSQQALATALQVSRPYLAYRERGSRTWPPALVARLRRGGIPIPEVA